MDSSVTDELSSKLKDLHDDLARMEVALTRPDEFGGTVGSQERISKVIKELPQQLREVSKLGEASKLQVPSAAIRAVETPGSSNPDSWLRKTLAQAEVAREAGDIALETAASGQATLQTHRADKTE